ncbi:secondary thiamine-phosphate synthase enzyme [Caldisphaera lagunensis DSM 15908]|uniref:Secondary thiamine-phosphate synthase enzyme n=1 Tax=Caldisphaera lagunensis (strain DSM 15908 / JCM 11604 / ANMR 0165 / IC-154) TaxID=1056495 RepID=L0ABA0_CALLD|nr:secondary thiamine-phosphate synthase enzyme YjbQ [Caldisphaera lagunensis]AFZ71168.1 secondary thiamine-phosphate synthase enzyme [Caldisphaera lagunensis DSM 15908]
MKFEVSNIEINTNQRIEILDITNKVENIIKQKNYEKGILNLYVLHTTAAITLNEYEPNLEEDLKRIISEIFRPDGDWKHNLIDDNAHAHLASSFIGNSRSLLIESGKIVLGTWQRILFIELDGPRKRMVKIVFIGE